MNEGGGEEEMYTSGMYRLRSVEFCRYESLCLTSCQK